MKDISAGHGLRLWALFLTFASLASPTAAQTNGPVRVQLQPDGEILRAEFSLPEPVQSYTFSDGSLQSSRAENWHVTSPGFSFDGKTVRLSLLDRLTGKAFDRFEMVIAADPPGESNTHLIQIGDGWFLKSSVLGPADAPYNVEFTAVAPENWTVRKHDPAPGLGYLEGYVLIGPAWPELDERLEVFADPGVPAKSVSVFADALVAGERYFSARLGAALPDWPPFLVAASYAEANFVARGTIGPAGLIQFSLGSEDWNNLDDNRTGILTLVALHELFHHYWSLFFRESEWADDNWWYSEGAAQYAARLALAELGYPEYRTLEDELNVGAAICRGAIGSTSLARTDVPFTARYGCGTLFFWALDLGIRKASGGEQSLLDLFRTVLPLHSETGGASPEILLAAAGDDAAAAAKALYFGVDGGTWSAFSRELSNLGAAVSMTRTDAGDRLALGVHLLNNDDCKPPTSITDKPNDSTLTLKGRPNISMKGLGCLTFRRDPTLDAVAGVSVFDDAAQAYDRVVDICADRGDVDLSFRGERVAVIKCKEPLARETLTFTVTQSGLATGSKAEQ